MLNLQTVFGVMLLITILYFIQKLVTESFVNYRMPADVVQTSGMETLTPLPYFVKYNYPAYWRNYTPPEIFYDIPFYGPIAKPWGRPHDTRFLLVP
jgi:hypothetical protein